MKAPKKITNLNDLIATMEYIEAMRQRVIAVEKKQKPFAEIAGLSIRTEICVN